MASLALLAVVAAYSALSGDRLVPAVAGVGCSGVVLALAALVARRAALLPWGLVGVGAGYAAYLGLGEQAVDPRAPLVAAAFFVAAELAFWSLERRDWRSEPQVVLRRLGLVLASGLATAIVGGLLLLITSGGQPGLAAEVAGVTAAVITLAVIAQLARRSRALRADELA